MTSKVAVADNGKDLRRKFPRSELGPLILPKDRDPVGIIAEQNKGRIQDLIGVRIGRMLQSPFAFYRGTAAVMAADLADAPITGPRVLLSGDAHISNFGFFASPERALLFDLNDFDETAIAPWEWDVRRLAASVHIGGRNNGMTEADCRESTLAAVEGYRTSLHQLIQLTATERYYFQVNSSELESLLSGKALKSTEKLTAKARSNTSNRVLTKITATTDSGELRINDEPPLTRHVSYLDMDDITTLFGQYLTTVREDIAYLMAQFKPVDFVLRVSGVGSVGTRCYLIAFQGPADEVLFLQVKEASASVLTEFGNVHLSIPGRKENNDASEGHRVIAGQRILQAQSDPFLGYVVGTAPDQPNKPRSDYYWRQFRDMKGSVDPTQLNKKQFTGYGELCGRMLARGHSQSPPAIQIGQYLGNTDQSAEAIADWAKAYADVAERDFEALTKAADDGRFPVERNV